MSSASQRMRRPTCDAAGQEAPGPAVAQAMVPGNSVVGKQKVVHPVRDGLLVTTAILLITTVTTVLMYVKAVDAQRAEVHDHLLRLTYAAATLVDGDLHRTLTSPDQYNTEPYNRILTPLRRFLQGTPGVKYVYTAILRDDQIHFGVDSALPVDGDGDGVIDQSGLMEVYEDADPYMWVALREGRAVTTPEPYEDKWGSFISGYVPFFDSTGQQVGVVGVDITTKQYEQSLRNVRQMAVIALIPAVILSGLAGWSCRQLRRREARREEAARTVLERGAREQGVVAAIAASPALVSGDVGQLARELTEQAAAALDIERVGVWVFDESETTLRCVDTYEMTPKRHTTGAVLRESEYRNEFEALKTAKYVDADNPLTDPRTAGYVEGYLKPLKISSMLDAVIRSSGRNLGAICFEHVNRSHHWETDEIGFACQLADQVALAFANGERRQAETDLVAARDAAERQARDLDESNRQLERAIRRANDMALRAEAACLAKSEFLANMSHEVRTPMTAILGFCDILLGEGNLDTAPPERIDAIRTIKRNGEYLLQIINDILDLSKIEAGKLTIERIACSVCEIVAEIESLIRVRSASKGLDLGIEYEGSIPETIQTDPIRLRQILINLLGNAVKFTETGSVRLILRLIRSPKGEPVLESDVVDTGLGMTEEQVAKLFRPFAQADSSTTRKFGGTGLGLVISKRLAQALGGDVQLIETKPGAGSRLRCRVATGPLDSVRMLEDPAEALRAKPEIPGEITAESIRLDGRILLAEDGPDNQRLISFVLKRAGAQVTVVENGRLAVEKALAAQEQGEPFDILLMDMQMPVMDGYEATSLLREKGYTLPIIALTAHAMAGDREKCCRAGCDDYATKPIDRVKLVETIARHLETAKAIANGSPASVRTVDSRADDAESLRF